MTTKAKASTKTTDQQSGEDEGGFRDITDDLEQAKKDAEREVEFDDEGNPKPLEPSEATQKVADEVALRAAGQGEGGGPWPPELLQKKYIGSGQRMRPPAPEYTSHEEQDESS